MQVQWRSFNKQSKHFIITELDECMQKFNLFWYFWHYRNITYAIKTIFLHDAYVRIFKECEFLFLGSLSIINYIPEYMLYL